MSRLGKYLAVLLAYTKRWKQVTMDVKSAFLQSDYIETKSRSMGSLRLTCAGSFVKCWDFVNMR